MTIQIFRSQFDKQRKKARTKIVAKKCRDILHSAFHFRMPFTFTVLLDINECRQAPSVCHRLAKCSNTEGSFSCQCDIGFTGDGIVNCTGIHENISPL